MTSLMPGRYGRGTFRSRLTPEQLRALAKLLKQLGKLSKQLRKIILGVLTLLLAYLAARHGLA
ncbi:hypothetical protein [Demequina sp.]|uniref:hypothetical protein n=1 Tax=Demequina sp. TaxID=2050685 RepID=UPI003D14AED0